MPDELAALLREIRSPGANRTSERIIELAYRHPRTRPTQVRSEIERFAAIVASRRPKAVLEIGTDCGGTFFILCQLAAPDAVMLSVDLRNAPYCSGARDDLQDYVLTQVPQPRQAVTFIHGNSHQPESLDKVRRRLTGELDLLFIDGDHSYEGVRRDFEMYSPLVRKGGMIGFHDIVEHPPELACEVARFWREIRSGYRYEEIIEDPNQNWAGIGVLYA